MSAYAIVADLAHEDRGWSFGTIDEATNRGALLGALPGLVGIGAMQLAGYTLIQVWPLLFGLYAVSAVAGLVLAARRIGETCHPKEFNAEARHPEPLQLFALMVIVLITGASTAMVWPIIVIFLQDNIGATAPILAAAYLPAALISSFLPAQLGKLTDHFGRKPLMAGGLVIGAVTSAFIPHLRSAIPLALLWAVDSLGYAASAPAERAFVADIAGVDTRGMSYGLYTFAFFLGAAFGPLAGGWLYDNMGHAAPFYANAIMLMIAAVLVFALLREPKAAAGKNARRSPR
jgi:DHA1 family multidrug resistance protein-like MFS transporter